MKMSSSNNKECLSFLRKLTFLGPNPIVTVQLILYSLSLFFGFFVSVPIGITLRRFGGNCILFGQLIWDKKTIWSWGESSCEYVLYMNLGVNIIYTMMIIPFIIVLILPKYKKEYIKNVSNVGLITKYQNDFFVNNVNPVMLAVNSCIWLLHVANAVIITVGFSRFCRSMEAALEKLGTPMSCAESQSNVDWSEYKMYMSQSDDGPDGSSFFTCVNMATVCSWILLIIWTLQLVINLGHVCTRCSCETAEEKVKIDASHRIAARRSRMATPSYTPGGGGPSGGIPYTNPMGAPRGAGSAVSLGQPPRGPASVSSYAQGPPRAPPSQSGYVTHAPAGWGRGPQSTSSEA